MGSRTLAAEPDPTPADTPATAALDAVGADYCLTRSPRAGSVEEAAAMRGIPVASLIKTIVVRRSEDDYVLVLVPGDRAIDWARLRNHLGERRLSLPDAAEAFAATGYERGTITPFGAKGSWPVVADAAIAGLKTASLGAGAHGLSIAMDASQLLDLVNAQVADVTKPG